jgi:hypothetical protein
MLTFFVWTLIGDLSDLEAGVGLTFPVVVLNFMSFDVFLTFKQFEKAKEHPFYAARVGGLVAILVSLVFFVFMVDVREILGGHLGFYLSDVLLLFVVVLFVVNFIIMAAAGLCYVKVNETMRGLDHARFEYESARLVVIPVIFIWF